MNLRTGTMSLRAKLKKLEDRAGKGRRNCPSCRLLLRRPWPDYAKPHARPEDFVSVKCEFCHATSAIYLGNFPEDERDAWRLWFSFTLEMWYLNSKARALGLWLDHRPQRNRSLAEDQQWRQQHRTATPGVAKGQTAGQRLVFKLRQESNDLLEKKIRMLRAMYGEGHLREQRELTESVRAKAEAERKGRRHVKGLQRLETARINYLICAELEKIIWGDMRPQTRSDLEKLQRAIDELIRTAEAKEAAAEAAKAAAVTQTFAESEEAIVNEKGRREAEAEESRRQAEERRKRIKRINRWRARFRKPLLPDDYDGPLILN